MNVFFFGLGYSAQSILAGLRAGNPDARIAGTTRSPERFDALAALGATPYVFGGGASSEALRAELSTAHHLVTSVAPGPAGDPVLNAHRDDILGASGITWMCYLSTIGVYGDAGGAWIDENYFGERHSERARQRLAAEVAWQRLAKQKDVPLLVLRLAGIYGPGRSAIDKLRSGHARRVIKPGQVFNRIHVADIGRVATLAAQRRLGGIFNLSDDLPAPPQDVMVHAAELLDVPPPPEVDFETAELSPMARAFYADSKRVSNQAIKQALGIDLLHPTYREGLAAILDAERDVRGRD